MCRPVSFFACLVLVIATTLHAQTPGGEARAARAYQAAAQHGPLALRAFLAQFPKGADLHVHLSGAVYAESFIRDAGEDGLCVDPAALSFAKPPCTPPLVEAAQVPANQEALRPAGRRLLHSQLCAYLRLQRPRPVFRDLRPF